MPTESTFHQEVHNSSHSELWYLNGTFQVIESTLSHAGILQIGGIGGVGLSMILGITASVALAIRGIFTYYLINYAPKGRALNRLMLFDQVIQLALGLVFYTLTVIAIGGQVTLRDYIGDIGCKTYALSFIGIAAWFAFGGLGVAVFRLLCLRDQTMSTKMRASIVKKILMAEIFFLVIISLPLIIKMTFSDKWEVMAIYRLCIDENLVQADIKSLYRNNEPLIGMTRSERTFFIFPVLLGQSAAIVEFGIYAKIIYGLWQHDKEYLLNGTITKKMAQIRNRKNVISLRGQIACFLVETCCISIYFIGFVFKFDDVSTLNPILTILSQSLVSIAQFFASYEMQRFVKEKFE